VGWRSRHLREDNVWFINRPDLNPPTSGR